MKRLSVSILCLMGIILFGDDSNQQSGLEEGFEKETSAFKMKATGDSSWYIDKTVKKSGENSLHMKVNKFFPKNLVSATAVLPVKAGEIYQINISFCSNNIEKNPNLKRQPALPEARIVLCNSKKKPATKPSGFIWLRSPFKNASEEWQSLTKIIKIPDGVHYITFTIFGYHKGDMWLDDISVKKIK
jgi:hypothetical protein